MVVVSIIILLTGLTFPLLKNVRDKAKFSIKTSNLRQIGVAHSLFATDNYGRIVPAQDVVNMGNDGQNWRMMLAPYIHQDDTTVNEANRLELFVDPFWRDYDINKAHLSGYAINLQPALPEDDRKNVHWVNAGAGQRSAENDFKLAMITEASKRTFLADSPHWFFKADQIEERLDMTRHENGRKGMVLMFDGTARLLTMEQVSRSINDPATLNAAE